MKFSEFDFTDEMLDSLFDMHFDEATPIQERTIPIIMDGRDLIACAQTGTGKTAAYLLPTIDSIVREPHDGIDTIVLVPTRELAIQIDQQMEGFGYYVDVTSTAVYGGNNSSEWQRQRTALTGGTDIVITTPGRMLQHIAMGYVDFSSVRHLILDEADRMLDMGFYDDIMQVVNLIPTTGRQTLMFSATMPPKIRELAKTILHDPEEISIAISKPAEGIRQAAYPVYDAQKPALVLSLLKGRKEQSVIIFSSRKQSVKELASQLKRKGINASLIHSDLEQTEREEVLRQFKNRNINVLVATDIIARGIDIPDIDMVINFDVPRDAEDYVHRIGRTARAKSKGEAYTFIVPKEMQSFGRIEKLIEKEVEKLPLPDGLGDAPQYSPGKTTGQHRRATNDEHKGNGHGRHNKRNGHKRNTDDNATNANATASARQNTTETPTGNSTKRRHNKHRRNNGNGDNHDADNAPTQNA